MRKRYFFLCLLVLTLIGCGTVKKSLDNYEACKGDSVCVEAMNASRDTAYAVTRGVTATAVPNATELIALGVSNLVAFAVGVWRGGKVKRP